MNEIAIMKTEQEKHLVLSNVRDILAKQIEENRKKHRETILINRENKREEKGDAKLHNHEKALQVLAKRWFDINLNSLYKPYGPEKIPEILALDEFVVSKARKILFFGFLGYAGFGAAGFYFTSGWLLGLFICCFLVLTAILSFQLTDKGDNTVPRDALWTSISLLKNRKYFLRQIEKELKQLEEQKSLPNPG